ncbi:MAG: carbohydrate ABC transporter permease [Oscillospiraceae bacterium]|jgi:multiple sugar transport system permease protein/putative aldouronate transport system permease protein|nr:carbohydrate ABC transporter permease [Oscillospiraceae bacterium]
MIKSSSIGSKVFNGFNYALMALLTFSCLYPLWYTFCTSISDKAATSAGLVTFWPIGPNLRSYQEIMRDSAFFNSLWISAQRTVLGTAFTLVVIIMLGYALSRKKASFASRNAFMWIVIFCMVFNGGTIPWWMMMKAYGLMDSVWGLVLCGSLPTFNVILVMNFFRNLPADVEEAAVVDGAGPWRILWGIVVPCSLPVLATVTLFVSVGYWNEFFQGLVLSSTQAHYPLQTYIKQLVVNIPQGQSLSREEMIRITQLSNRGLNAAKVFITMIPMLLIYPFLQRYFISGIMLGAVKE